MRVKASITREEDFELSEVQSVLVAEEMIRKAYNLQRIVLIKDGVAYEKEIVKAPVYFKHPQMSEGYFYNDLCENVKTRDAELDETMAWEVLQTVKKLIKPKVVEHENN